MKLSQILLLVCTVLPSVTLSYSSSWEDCEAFAALFSNSCGGTEFNAAYETEDWETNGPGASIIQCATNDPEYLFKVRAPDTGNVVASYSIFARNCITCRNSTDMEHAYIRVQSNGMPFHCYSNDQELDAFPQTQKIDVEMLWNPDVLRVENVAEASITDVATTEAVLCDDSFLDTIPSSSEITNQSVTDLSGVVGISMQNVVIKTAIDGNSDALLTKSSIMDSCLTYADSSGILTSHSFDACTLHQASQSQAPYLCQDSIDNDCVRNPGSFGVANFTLSDIPYQTPMGLAKDGHIIVGPYNEDGELWNCEDHDICNGVFLEDNSYAYAMTYTFPYVVGCWGPGPKQLYDVGCSSRSCTGAISGLSFAATSILALAALLQI